MMPPATAEEIAGVLGDVDAFTLERILETRATVDDVAEALADLEDERRFGEHRDPTSTTVAEVRRALEEIVDDDDDAAYTS